MLDLPGVSRRTLLKSAAAAALLPGLGWAAGRRLTEPFALADVQLGEGEFARARAVNRQYLLAHEVDRFLAGFRIEAGLKPRAEKYPNWESMGLDGHSAGHYLTALAQETAAGDAEMAARLDYMLEELAICQRANGNGYLGAVPDGEKMWREVAAGQIDSPGFALNGRWVPFYNIHKTFQGLRDAWLIAARAPARDMLVAFADWCVALVADLDDAQMQLILATEHGGMNEALADVHAITGERRYLDTARRFCHRALLDPLLRREDALDGLHANTQIPKVIGFARIGELDGDAGLIGAATFFWETVVLRRNVAFGGNSVREHFNPADDFSSMVESREGPETCNTYNLLRLSMQLYRLDPQARYADYVERALFNHILSSQHPQHGGYVYFTPIRPRHYRVYSQPGECFWCCVGSGMENHGKYAAFAYAQDGDALTVNQFMASTVRWAGRGVTLTQHTAFPDAAGTRLVVGADAPQRFTLRIRHPAWLSGEMRIRVNGRDWPNTSTPSSYAEIARVWEDGDQVEIALPMTTRTEELPDGSGYVAVLHGPIVLAAATGTDDVTGLIADDGRGSHIAPGPYLPLEQAPMLVGDPARLADGIRPVPGRPMTFEATPLLRPAQYEDLRLQPLFRTHDVRYSVYWRTATAQAYPAVLREIEEKERARAALEARTVDHVAPGEQQPEVEHDYRGRDTESGLHLGRRWRDTGAWMSYRLRAPGDAEALDLMLTFYGADRHDGFVLRVNDHRIATIELAGAEPERFIDLRFPIPTDVVQAADGRGLEVKLMAGEQRTARLFGLRLVRPEDPQLPRRLSTGPA